MTFSIVARDPGTGAVGVAVQSKFVSVGAVVPFAASDAGAIATQSFANVAYGPDGLDLLRDGLAAAEVVERLTAVDDEAESRQAGVVGRDGSVAAFTGTDCLDVAGDVQGDGYAVQGNVLANEDVLPAMAEAFEATAGGLPERLISALRAGNDAGGDSRGEQSAALYVAKEGGGYDGGNDRWIDVRVDDHERPIDELERVFKLYDVTLLPRAEPDELRTLAGETAAAVAGALADAGFYGGDPEGVAAFDDDERTALATFRGVNNFENHSLAAIEDALARGWDDANVDGATSDDGTTRGGANRLVDAVWHGLSGRPRI
ncbi:DUF1028 domain-containing protein [Halegenticoccus tardaugens]|uniref:DUF1028 domain-containing protein n=1 Tax=Halegenticoccus tardaugens TaxID=2071624 RepID=UPI00100B4618|nr:DUF1028 domain-containing protein [Halegenticoccus tardaugens]